MCSEEKPEVEELSSDLDFLTDRHLSPASKLRLSPVKAIHNNNVCLSPMKNYH